MLYGIPEIIAYLTTVTDLRPGDVIATGSPSGLGRQQDPPVYLQEGDTMTIEVEGIGTLVNDVARGS
jgi:2-keto-4-pentenoate hydratase/2-oxohepta-3-ene-1,7-dioic acid hydratase in catechol pathway